jgi:uncharacterized protein YodC (DUF2158 family)
MDFKIGDVVKLKSGGPKMTVSTIKDGEVWCTWFEDDKLARPYWFAPDMLERYTPNTPRVIRSARG